MNKKSHLEIIDTISKDAISVINEEQGHLNNLFEEYKDYHDFIAFVERVIEWMGDKDKRHLLYELFNKVFSVDPVGFMLEFGSFASHDLLDDGSFSIVWEKLTWNGTIESTEEDLDASPIVIRGYDEGTQDISKLMKAMDRKEEEVIKRHEMERRKNELLAKFRLLKVE